jgi:ABC-type Fe3+-hydroxamate transport system substrate-binding protein
VDSGEVWFIQRGSLHGSVLEAAGARNAVPDTPSGGPRLGLEELVALDPDLVIVLTTSDHDHTADGFRSLHGLRAARQQRIGVVRGPAVFATGPSVLDLVTQLEHEVHRLR